MPDTFGAKQIASRIGTDPKTFRKFLRSDASPYEAVGQGGRYEFPKEDLADIKKAFMGWQGGKRPKKPSTPVDPDSARRTREAVILATASLITEEDLLEEDDPTDEDLADIEDEELDIDE